MNRRALIAVLLVLATSVSIATEPPGRWHWPYKWFWSIQREPWAPPDNDQLVTNNSGAKSELIRTYHGGDSLWIATGITEDGDFRQNAFECRGRSDSIYIYRPTPLGGSVRHTVDYCGPAAILTVVCQALALTGWVLTHGSRDGVRV